MNSTLSYAEHSDETIFGFVGNYEFLTPSFPCSVVFKNKTFPSFLNAFLSEKTSVPKYLTGFVNTDPYRVAEFAAKIPAGHNWGSQQAFLLKDLTYAKFFQNPGLLQKLLRTDGKKLIYANHFGDTEWGVDKNGNGKNALGLTLESIRDGLLHLKEEEKVERYEAEEVKTEIKEDRKIFSKRKK